MSYQRVLSPIRRMAARASLMRGLVAICAVFVLVPSAGAQQPSVEVTAVPSALEIPATLASVPLLVIVRNTTTAEIRNVRLTFFADAQVKIEPKEAAPVRLAPGAEIAFRRWVSAIRPPVTGSLHARIDYVTQTGNAPAAHIRTQTIKMSNRALSPTDEIVAVKVESSLQTLQEHRPGEVHLVLTNKSDTIVEVSSLTATAPEFVKLERPEGRRWIQPRQTITVTYTAKPEKRVVPGKHLLVFSVGLKWPAASGEQQGTIVATREVEVGVFGESSILTAFAVPSFLLLPGCLVLLTAKFLWDDVRVLRPKSSTGELRLKFPTAEFWLVSITLSGVIATMYGWIFRQSYLDAYGVGDLVRVWLLSIILGAGGYVLVRLASRATRELSSRDRPLTALRKLAWSGLPLVMDCCSAKVGEKQAEGFALDSDYATKASCWFLPPIEVAFNERATGPQRANVTSTLTDLAQLSEVNQALRSAVRSGAATVKWGRQEWLDRPTEVKTEGLAFKEHKPLVQVIEDVAPV